MADTDEESFDRSQDDDHDLLTFGEAGLRLQQAIDELSTELQDAGEPRAAILRARIAVLQQAQTRSQSHRLDCHNFEQFFGYRGQPRRNNAR